MTDAAPAVALLFDDVELGARLRDVLQEHGAHIVHEGDVASLDQQSLSEVAADVVVVSLDDAATDALDQLYGLIDGGRPRVEVRREQPAEEHLLACDEEQHPDHRGRHAGLAVADGGARLVLAGRMGLHRSGGHTIPFRCSASSSAPSSRSPGRSAA